MLPARAPQTPPRRQASLRQGTLLRRAPHLLRERDIVPRIACPGIDSSKRLGRHPWKIERSLAWLFGHHRRTVRYERKGQQYGSRPESHALPPDSAKVALERHPQTFFSGHHGKQRN
ncbi:hypothetical protein GCM10010245_57820 [Streptomyces spectabilis]|nr:hypothetical protein GCM10010245_57820 [Streptomyces spectabilis]